MFLPLAEERSALAGVALVADGIGGERGGDEASRLAVERVCAEISSPAQSRNQPASPPVASLEDLSDALRRTIRETSDEIFRLGQHDPEVQGLGSTLVAAVFCDHEALIAHVGDSRCYRVRGDKIKRLTDDHTWVASQVAAGLLTPEEAHRHPQRNVLTRTLGDAISPGVDVRTEALEHDDLFLLCSDGLSNALSDLEILQIAKRFSDPQDLAEALVALANDKDGSDNITAVACRCHDRHRPGTNPEETEPILRPDALRRPPARRSWWIAAVLAVLLVAGLWIGPRIAAARAFDRGVEHARAGRYLHARQEFATAIRWGLDRKRSDQLLDWMMKFPRSPRATPPEPRPPPPQHGVSPGSS